MYTNSDPTNIGTKAFIKLEEKMGKHFERKPIGKLEEGRKLEFNGATNSIK